jgi:YesN/AraC family two-component response regulator
LPSHLALNFIQSSALRKDVYENVSECFKALLTVQALARSTAFNRHYVSKYVKHETPPKEEYGIKPTLSSGITSLQLKI